MFSLKMLIPRSPWPAVQKKMVPRMFQADVILSDLAAVYDIILIGRMVALGNMWILSQVKEYIAHKQ
jgi:hypothetical protein